MATRQSGGYRETELVASAARTTSSDSGVLDGFSDSQTMSLLLQVTAASGTTPQLNVALEHTYDGTTWYELGRIGAANIAAAGHYTLDIGPGINDRTNAAVTPLSGTQAHSRAAVNATFADRLRIKWTISGTTPSFTFRVLSISQTPTS